MNFDPQVCELKSGLAAHNKQKAPNNSELNRIDAYFSLMKWTLETGTSGQASLAYKNQEPGYASQLLQGSKH